MGLAEIPYLEKFEAHVYAGPGDRRLPYRLLTPLHPEPGRRYPLVMFLHGVGERGKDNVAQLRNGVAEWLGSDDAQARYPSFFLVPQCPEGQYWTGAGETIGQPEQLVMEALRSVVECYAADPSRLYLGGLSMGAFGVWHLLGHYPGFFAAAFLIAGGGDPSIAPQLVTLPLWFFQGAEDDVVPPEYARVLVATLQQLGGTVRYTEYPNVGHDSWRRALQEPGLLAWLFAQGRE